MKSELNKLIVKSLYVSIVLFVLRSFIIEIQSMYDLYGAIGEVISITLILMSFYCSFLWRLNPFESIPKIMGDFEGIIEYNYNGESKTKKTEVKIIQSLISTKVMIWTNEIMSQTIASELIKEGEQYCLYYTYITNPKSKYSKENPIQYGTCKLIIQNKNKLEGTYWTNRQTIGDIELKRKSK